MTATLERAPISLQRGATLGRGRRVRDRLSLFLMLLSLAIAAVPLVVVLAYVVGQGAAQVDFAFLTEELPVRVQRSTGGIGPAIVGTLLTTGFGALLAIPIGILVAVYLHEYGGGNRFATVVRFLANVMAGVPSVVMGLFVFTVWVLPREQDGPSALSGGLALACLMLPIVIRSTEAMLRLVPMELREAAYALGTSKSRTILTVILPAALPGITSGSLLAVARAAGETAPILFTVGASRQFNWSLSGVNTTLSAQIFSNAQAGYDASVARAWGAALTLIALVVTLSVVARVISARFTVR